jgi:polyisoprenoid-binding protein YceI
MSRTLAALALLLAVSVNARSAERWQLGADSRLSFEAIQQGAAFEGRFEIFEADIEFAADDLANSHWRVTVDTGSVNTDYADRDEVLRDAPFFNVMRWPEARFEADAFRALGGDAYEASGNLTLRDQTHPLTFQFTFVGDGASATLEGEVVVARLEFGIGQGEWSDTTWIGPDVTVRFDVRLTIAAGQR